ncbi:hypothetical protein [Nocardioides litoris]|uniref:hypothetical protein n=1 Tax=Nocardioides litoris TaxID=1926648 RepID=UPI00111FF762|nr:hypothetical protein [Nocardioides litoris]
MNPLRTTAATLAATALVATPLAVLTAAPAQAAEKSGRCDGATFKLEVEKDDGRYEIDTDIDDARPGSQWRIVLKQDGRTLANVVRRADSDGDVDGVDRERRDTRGTDRFVLRVNKVGTSGGCALRIVR